MLPGGALSFDSDVRDQGKPPFPDTVPATTPPAWTADTRARPATTTLYHRWPAGQTRTSCSAPLRPRHGAAAAPFPFMDTLTHALSGALCARATAPAHVPGRTLPVGRRMLVGTLAAAFPDIDGVTELMSPLAYLEWHRGITHSFLMLPLWTLALAWLCSRLWRDGLGWRAYAGVIALGIGIHIVGDWITSFGTMFLAPLSDRRFALSTTFIIDLVFTGIIVAGLVACLVWRRSRAPAVAGMLALAGYVALQAVQRERAIDFGVEHARAAGMPQARVDALPRPVSPFHWMVVVEDGDRIEHASVSLVRERAVVAAPDAGFIARLSAAYEPLATVCWTRVDRYGAAADAALAREALAAPALDTFRWFAGYPVLLRVDRAGDETCAWFQDLRFFTPGRDTVPFRFGACRQGAGAWTGYQLDDERGRVPLAASG
jgi:inner membrane protein